MVESTIKNAQPTINVKLVNASRGKVVRAEPISALYEQGKVFHRIPFIELEDELCIFEPGMDQSPNRLDAMVWSITELSGEGYSMLDVL
jgi:phage terminase large subunit-like protein